MTSIPDMYRQAKESRQQMVQQYVAPHNPVPQQQAEGVPQQVVPQVVQRLDTAKLMNAWNAYMTKIKETNGQLYGSMRTQPLVAADGITVELRIASEYERENIEKNEDLVQFLRQATGNSNLLLKAVVDATVVKEKEVVYTSSQKLEKMIEKNPAIKDLIKELSLILG
ncbi:MAG: hypothetical protein MJZ27_08975 [Bacteroidales bacterium]|nr:hypothetical protein [Bacteroidales bacterium]